MKAYLFIETGEVRSPKKGEWFKDTNGGTYQSDGMYNLIFPILTRHEIEIPEKFTEVKIIAGSLCDINAVVRIIPIPRPKKKVKKTVYLHVQKERGKTVYDVQIGTPILFGDDAVYPVEIEMEE